MVCAATWLDITDIAPFKRVGSVLSRDMVQKARANIDMQNGATRQCPNLTFWGKQPQTAIDECARSIGPCLQHGASRSAQFCGLCPVNAVRTEEVVGVGTWIPSDVALREECLVCIWSIISRTDRSLQCPVPHKDETFFSPDTPDIIPPPPGYLLPSSETRPVSASK